MRTGGLNKLFGPCSSCWSSIDASMAFMRASSISGALSLEGRSWVGASTAKEGGRYEWV